MINKNSKTSDIQILKQDESNHTNQQSRREFIGGATSAAAALTIVPRQVLGGKGFVAPSDKITLAYIGTGTQGLRELLPLLAIPELEIIAVCEVVMQAISIDIIIVFACIVIIAIIAATVVVVIMIVIVVVAVSVISKILRIILWSSRYVASRIVIGSCISDIAVKASVDIVDVDIICMHHLINR